MSSWHDEFPASPALDAIAREVEENPRVMAVVLTGSWAHEMATEHSDIDLLIVLDRDDFSFMRESSDGIDVSKITFDRLRDIPEDPGRWWDRYSYGRSRILFDRSEGYVGRTLEAWGTLTTEETTLAVDFHIDGYLTFAYRSLKSWREGRGLAARFDAAESLPWAMSLLFAVHGRVRPANKYLRWELDREPLPGEGWEAEHVVDVLERILGTGSADAQRELFSLIEPQARQIGFGGVIDSFQPGVDVLRGAA